jgi:hypothetical protein
MDNATDEHPPGDPHGKSSGFPPLASQTQENVSIPYHSPSRITALTLISEAGFWVRRATRLLPPRLSEINVFLVWGWIRI